MITDALEAITSRKWLMELILAAVLVAGVYFFCQHMVDVGVQKQRDADLAELVVLQHDADIKTAKAQERADLAEKARDIEITQLDDYRRLHPLHGRLCVNEGGGHLPAAGTADRGDAGASTGTGNILEVPAGIAGPGGQGDPDVRHLLDIFARRADVVSSGLRERQARD